MFKGCFQIKAFTIFLTTLVFNAGYAQNVGINSSGAAPDASAMLEVTSTNKGLLIPRVALTSVSDVSTISSPATSLLVYNTTNNGSVTEGYYYYTSGGWIRINTGNASVSGWGTSGTGSITAANFLGPTNSTPLIFKIAGNEYMRIATTGSVGVGTSTFSGTNAERLLVDAGTTSNNVIVGKANVNGYVQLNIINSSSGNGASTDVVATNDVAGQGTYIDMGINSSGNSSTGVLGGNNTAYLQSVASGDLAIGNATAGRILKFFTNGTATGDEKMRITSGGLVGINNTNPGQALDITGNLRFSGAIMPGGDAGSANEVLISQGAGNAPVWLNPNGVLNGISWLLTGNTNASEQKIGTNNGFDLPFVTNGVERMRINTGGNFGIGANPGTGVNAEKFLVDAGTSTYNVISARGTNTGYLQMNIKNYSNGVGASTDIVATNNTGTESVNYIDMGINSSTYTVGGVLGGPSTAYLHSTGADLAIGNSTTGKNLMFFTTTGAGAGTPTERMRILPTGEVAIGQTTVTATYKFEVNGTARSAGWVNSSDRRLKTNIKGLMYGLKDVLALQPVSYNWIDSTQNKTLQLGLIAQDAKKIIPEIVSGDESKEMLGVNYTELIPVLINAIKEQQKQIDELKKSEMENKLLISKLSQKRKSKRKVA